MERISPAKRPEMGESEFRALVDGMPQLAWIADENGWIFWYNQRWFDYTGTTLAEMEGWGWTKVHHADHVQHVIDSFSKAIETGEVWEDSFPLRSKEGEFRWFLSRAFPGRDSSGKIVRWYGTNTDTTEQRAKAEELERSNSDLEQFAYIASHDLQEPLRKVSSYADLLRARLASGIDADARRYFEHIMDGTQRLKTLILDLLSYSRVGRAELSMEPVDTASVVRTVLGDMEPQLREKSAKVTVSPLPTAICNRTMISQVFQNLLGNALKFSKGAPQIEVSATNDGTMWIFRVKDNGIGIPEEFREKIFLPFYRVHSQREFAGSGIGLAICKRIIERHRGRILAEPGMASGASILFTLPAEPQ